MKTVAFLAALASCSGSAQTELGATDTTASDIATFENLANATSAAATSYGAATSTLDVTPATCRNLHDAYDGQVRPWISQMTQTSHAMDDFIGSHGGTLQTDMTCVTTAMQTELDRHASVVCAGGSVTSDQVEVAHHTTAMKTYAAQIVARSGEMLAGISTHAFVWGANACGPTDPSLALGQRIFQRGLNARGEMIAHTSAMGTMVSCAACHGAGGHGLMMAPFGSSNVTYASLSTRYDDASLERAVTAGVDPNGQRLSVWMPQWQLTRAEWAALLGYLKTLP